MRRFLFFFFVVNLFLIACGRKELRNDLQQLYLQGEIKQIRTSSYTVLEKFDQIEKKSKTTERENTLLTFNEKGNQVEKTLFSPTDKPTRIYTYLYDMKGNRALVNETLDDGTLKKRYIYTYDDKGRLLLESSPTHLTHHFYTLADDYDEHLEITVKTNL